MKQIGDKRFGAIGEKAAADYLQKNGYKILKKNYSVSVGEIDLIASRGEVIAFVEVKTRSAAPMVRGFYAVDTRKREHILRVASIYLSQHKTRLQPRFDIVEVEIDRRTMTVGQICHFEGAYTQTGDYGRF